MNNIHIESDFKYKGYRCIVVVNRMTIRCGYVIIDKEHPFYERKFEENELMCHGGITFCDYIERIGFDDNEKMWAIGFDCGHYGDKLAVDEAIEYGLVEADSPIVKSMRSINNIDSRNPCSVVYCEEELKMIVYQMEVMKNAKAK